MFQDAAGALTTQGTDQRQKLQDVFFFTRVFQDGVFATKGPILCSFS